MKKIFLLMPLAFALSCTNDASNTSNQHDGHNHDAHDGHDHASAKAPISYKTHDPICGMERDTAWTDYSVYNGDTVTFCATVCKETFDKNPAKYTAQ